MLEINDVVLYVVLYCIVLYCIVLYVRLPDVAIHTGRKNTAFSNLFLLDFPGKIVHTT